MSSSASDPQPQETDYISFLESQLEKSDHERLLVVNQIEGLARHFGEMTTLRSELADRAHQLSIVQQQLSQETLLVQEEREKVARLMGENAVLNAQTDDDRSKIASLICLRRSEMGVSSGGPAGLHPSLLAGGGSSNAHVAAAAGEGYHKSHLHVYPPVSPYQERLLERERLRTGSALPPADRCIPTGNVPIRVQTFPQATSAPYQAAAAGGERGKHLDTMSLRSTVTDYANTHQHTFPAGGPSRHSAGHCTNDGSDRAATAKAAVNSGNNSHSQHHHAAPPRGSGYVLATHYGVGGVSLGGALGTEAAISDALKSPLGSQLVTALAAEVDTLKILLDEQRRAYEAERARRLHEERQRTDTLIAKDRAQVTTIARLQDEIQTAVKELVLYRHQQQIIERALRGEIELLKVSCVETQRSVTHVANRKTKDLALALELAATKSQNQMVKFRGEMADKRAAHFAEKEALLAAVVKLREENDKLIKNLEKERKTRVRAEKRLILEREGAQSEIGLLKHHLRAIEKKLYFSHAKEVANGTSTAKLLASLVAQQVAQQREQEQRREHYETDDDNDIPTSEEDDEVPQYGAPLNDRGGKPAVAGKMNEYRASHPSPVFAEASSSPYGRLQRTQLDDTAEGLT